MLKIVTGSGWAQLGCIIKVAQRDIEATTTARRLADSMLQCGWYDCLFPTTGFQTHERSTETDEYEAILGRSWGQKHAVSHCWILLICRTG